MEYLSVREIAEKWDVSVRMVNYYLNTGRIPEAVRKTNGWLIPANTPRPADHRSKDYRRKKQERIARCYMPLISLPCPKNYRQFEKTLNDPEERRISRALWYYFRDEQEAARMESAECLASPCPEIRLSAWLVNTMAMIPTGDAELCRTNIKQIEAEVSHARDPEWRMYAQTTKVLVNIFFHLEEIDIQPMKDVIGGMPTGMQCFTMYAVAHSLYIQHEYERAMGVAEAALMIAGDQYPIASIYLNIVLCMVCMALKQDARADALFDRAWALARRDGYIHPFVEHHGMLQGQMERALREEHPEQYETLTESVYRFSRGWMKIHNPVSSLQVTDALTPFEFALGMLAAKGRSNREIAKVLNVSPGTVKSYLDCIFRKLKITKRSELESHLNR